MRIKKALIIPFYSKPFLIQHRCIPFHGVIRHWFFVAFDHFPCVILCATRGPTYFDKIVYQYMWDLTGYNVYRSSQNHFFKMCISSQSWFSIFISKFSITWEGYIRIYILFHYYSNMIRSAGSRLVDKRGSLDQSRRSASRFIWWSEPDNLTWSGTSDQVTVIIVYIYWLLFQWVVMQSTFAIVTLLHGEEGVCWYADFHV